MAEISKAKMWLLERVIGTEAEVRRPFEGVEWEQAAADYQVEGFEYPEYYRRDFHGVRGGYLQPDAAITYDPVTARIVFPNEIKIREAFVSHVKAMLGQTQPDRILDMGVGTGTASLMWRKLFPQAAITGIDLSPYMLVAAALKLKDQQVELVQANAEDTGMVAGSFDLVTATFLFHEIPQNVARRVVAEAKRLLKPGGTLAVFDGNQHGSWLVKTVGGYFPEPYIKDYMSSDLEQMCREVGFMHVNVKHHRRLYQFVTASRPLTD